MPTVTRTETGRSSTGIVPDEPMSRSMMVVLLLTVSALALMIGFAIGEATTGDEPAAVPVSDAPVPSLGSPDAPVTMVEYSDFKCPYCGRYAREVEPALIERYVEPGLVRIEWRDYPAQGGESMALAVAGRAAAEQDRFWEFHEQVFAHQQDTFDDERIRQAAEAAGVDMEQFERARQEGGYALAVRADYEQGMQRGVGGTPSFFVNGRQIVGAQPLGVFVEAIESALDEATS